MLKVQNISTGYGKKQVLFDVSLEVKQGESILIVGSNGSGKSTLLKAIYGILPILNNGSIWFDNENITGKPTASLLKKGLLYIPQKNNIFEDLTVQENLEMAGLMLNPKVLKLRIEDALSVFTALVPNYKRIPLKLSGGERKMLAIAMATLHKPKMILIDEPFTGLSSQNLELISGNLKTLNKLKGITLLIIEHRVKECSQISNKVIGLKLGKVFSESDINATFVLNELKRIFV